VSKSNYKSFDEISLEQLLSQSTKLENGCMHWGPITSNGYGTIRVGQQAFGLHRFVAKLAHGNPAPNQIAMHSCNHRPCINPEHLSWGTQSENLKYAVILGRHYVSGVKGESCGRSKLSEAEVLAIRKSFSPKMNSVALAKKYNVSKSNIMSIVKRKSWKHI